MRGSRRLSARVGYFMCGLLLVYIIGIQQFIAVPLQQPPARVKVQHSSRELPPNLRIDNDKLASVSIPPNPQTKDIPHETMSLAVVILACNRAASLDLTLKTWHRVAGIERVPLFVSLDCRHEETWDVARRWRKEKGLVKILESFQIDVVETGEQKLRTDERVTRHFISAVSRLFNAGFDRVVYAEDDQIVTADILSSVDALIEHGQKSCPSCFSLNLGCRKDCWGQRSTNPREVVRMESGNTGVVYDRDNWKQLQAHADSYCSMYGNWDNNIHFLAARKLIKPHSLTFVYPRIHHLTTCFSSRSSYSFTNRECKWDEEYKSAVAQESFIDGPLVDLGRARFTLGSYRGEKSDEVTQARCLQAFESTMPEPVS